jgi:hypothetical protein
MVSLGSFEKRKEKERERKKKKKMRINISKKNFIFFNFLLVSYLGAERENGDTAELTERLVVFCGVVGRLNIHRLVF